MKRVIARPIVLDFVITNDTSFNSIVNDVNLYKYRTHNKDDF